MSPMGSRVATTSSTHRSPLLQQYLAAQPAAAAAAVIDCRFLYSEARATFAGRAAYIEGQRGCSQPQEYVPTGAVLRVASTTNLSRPPKALPYTRKGSTRTGTRRHRFRSMEDSVDLPPPSAMIGHPPKLTGAVHVRFSDTLLLRGSTFSLVLRRLPIAGLSTAGSPEWDRKILTKTKFATRLLQWRESRSLPIDEWDGVGVNADGRVEKLDLPRKQVKCQSRLFGLFQRRLLLSSVLANTSDAGRFVLLSIFPGSGTTLP